MLNFLLALIVLVVGLQGALMAMLRRLVQQLELERRRIAALEQRVTESAQRDTEEPPAEATFHLRAEPAPAPEPRRRGDATGAEPAAAPPPAADALRGEMLALMRQLVAQGMSVREIAARCALSEAEAELMLSLNEGAS